MPTGLGLCDAAARAGLKVIAMARFDESLKDECVHQANDLCTVHPTNLTKPVKPVELAACLGAIFSGAGAPVQGVRGAPAEPDPSRAGEGRYRILVVEDNLTNQEVATGILQELGYDNVAVSSTAREALDALSSEDFDLVFMDCQLPDLDGYEATRLIRDRTTPVRSHHVPIVAMTAQVLPGERERCLEAGMNDYVAKPIRPEALQQALERNLKGSCASGSGSGATAAGVVVEAMPAELPAQAPAPSSAKPPLDREDLMDRLMDNPDLARRILTGFLAEIPAQLVLLDRALKESDHDAARRAAHTLRGSAANAGGRELSGTAARMEAFGKAGDLNSVRELMPELTSDVERFRADVAEFLEFECGAE